MYQVVLCIDDEPSRYALLAKHLADNNVLVVVTHKLQDVMFYFNAPEIYKIIGVCLDCDMPGSAQGFYYASNILNEKNIPVVIASMNPSEAMKCADILEEYATPNLLHPIIHNVDWVYRTLNFFGL